MSGRSHNWQTVPFVEAVEPRTDAGKRVARSAYLPQGRFPIIDQGEGLVGGYTNDANVVYEGPLPVIVFGDHTRRVKYIDFPFAVGAQGVKLLLPRQGWSARFLAHLMSVLPIQNKGYSRHYELLRGQSFIRPSRDEQDVIVAQIEKHFTRLDAAVASLEQVRARLAAYRASIMQVAVTQTARGVDDCEWPVHRLGRHLTFIDAGKSFRCVERPPQGDEIGVIKISAVTWGSYDEDESKTCHSVSSLDERLLVRPGDFLFSRANTLELVGACVIARHTNRRVMLSDKILRFTFDNQLDPRWALIFLRSHRGRSQIEALASGNQLSMRNIGQDRIRQIELPVPSLAVQVRIVKDVERQLGLATGLERQVQIALTKASRLKASTLAAAFDGRLAIPIVETIPK